MLKQGFEALTPYDNFVYALKARAPICNSIRNRCIISSEMLRRTKVDYDAVWFG